MLRTRTSVFPQNPFFFCDRHPCTECDLSGIHRSIFFQARESCVRFPMQKTPCAKAQGVFLFFVLFICIICIRSVFRHRCNRRFFGRRPAERPFFHIPHDKKRDAAQNKYDRLKLRRRHSESYRAPRVRSEKFNENSPYAVCNQVNSRQNVVFFEIQ